MPKKYAVVTFVMVQKMRKMRSQGQTYEAIAKSLKCSTQTVWMYAGPNGYLKHRHRSYVRPNGYLNHRHRSNGRNVLRLIG